MKARGDKITALTAWDYLSARFADEAGVDLVLVGDSLAMTIRGDVDTLRITIDDMIYHTAMVCRGATHAMVVGDMPFMSFQLGPDSALLNAGRFVKEGGAQAIKIEGGAPVAPVVRRVTGAGIPVMGHIGLTPQSVHQIGGFKVQAKEIEDARQLIADAKALEEAGAFALVLECLPAELAAYVTERVSIPTIGIGAGRGCDGQIQVSADVLGLLDGAPPRHAKKYADLATQILKAYTRYTADVRQDKFPTQAHSFIASDELKQAIEAGEL